MIEGIDKELDEMGVILEKPVYCFKCKVRMVLVDKSRYKCPKCGQEYEGNSQNKKAFK